MNRLTDISIGSLKSGSRRERRTTTLQQPAPVEELPADLLLLRSIPGIEPFYTPGLIPDLIYLLELEGLNRILDRIYPIPQPTPGRDQITSPSEPDPSTVEKKERRSTVKMAFDLFGLQAALLNILFPNRGTTNQEVEADNRIDELKQDLLERGRDRLTILVAQADPRNPQSIIFQHSSQNVHRATQKVQIELIKNEPDVQERSTIQCACGSGKVRTTTVQTRRADEAPTIYAQCVSCKTNWKMSAA